MIINKTKNTVINVIWGCINKTATIILPFIIRTIIIKTLGADYLGLNGLFTSILSVLSISELGISTAIVYSMYRPIAEENAAEICALMRLYRIAYRFIAIIVGVIGLILVPFLNNLIKGPIEIDINIYCIYLIYLGNSVLSYSLFAYKTCLFLAHQRNAVVYKVQTITVIIQYILQILVLVIINNYYFYVAVLLVTTILQNIILALKASREYPNYTCKGVVSKKKKKEIVKQIGGLIIGKVNISVRNTMDSIFVSAFIGLTANAMYSNYWYITTAVVSFINIISTSMIAGVGNSVVTNSCEKNYDDFEKLTFLSRWLVAICSICTLCLIQPFMKIWVGEKLMLNNAMAVICALYILVGQSGMIRGVYNEALGLWWKMRIYTIIDIPVNLIMNLIFIYKWGVYGIVLATIVCIGGYGILFGSYILFKEYFGKNKYRKYIIKNYLYILIISIIGGVTYIICQFDMKNDFMQLCFNFIVSIVVPNVLLYIIYKDDPCFRYAYEKIKIIVCKVLKSD